MRLFLLIPVFISSLCLTAQVNERKVIQFTGIVMTSDSLIGIPFVNIFEKHSMRGTSTNLKGFFSFVAQEGDTILFSAVGFMDDSYVIPFGLKDDKYSIIQLLTSDTVYLAETIIYPWPTPRDFRKAFLAYDVPDTYLDIARKNLERERLKEMGLELGYDADANQDYYTKQIGRELYYAGQNPPLTIFNVFNWIEFFEAWKRGDFKSNK